MLPHQYMKRDLYLVRWLRAKSFNLRQAEEMLVANLQWRKREKMDTIHLEDWSDMESKYEFRMNGVDKEGKPIFYFNPGSWNIREIANSKHVDRFMRYIDKAVDQSCVKVRMMEETQQNVTQGILIMNGEGGSPIQHFCLKCVTIYLRGIQVYDKYFPGCAEKIVSINIPQVVQPMVRGVIRHLSPISRNSLKIFGTDKPVWQKYLLEFIDRSHLPKELGL